MRHYRRIKKQPEADENGYTPDDRRQLRMQYTLTTGVAVSLFLSVFAAVVAISRYI